MRLPFVWFRSRTDPTVAEALGRIEDRLDRLIAIGQRTNELLKGEVHGAAATPRQTDQRDQPTSAAVPELRSGHAATKTPRSGRRKSTGGPLRRTTAVADEPAHVARPLKLHGAIIRVLLDAGEPLTANDIAARIRERKLFAPPRSGHELRGGQVSARVGNATYRDRFVRRDGRIWLADPDAERLRLTDS